MANKHLARAIFASSLIVSAVVLILNGHPIWAGLLVGVALLVWD